MGRTSWWRRLWPLRFYRSAAVNNPRASGAWYFEWRGRGWHIEAVPIDPKVSFDNVNDLLKWLNDE